MRVCVCVWPDCYIDYSGLLTLLLSYRHFSFGAEGSGQNWRYPSTPSFPAWGRVSATILSTFLRFFLSFFFFSITVLHCKMYSSIRRHQYTSAFKYVKLQRGHRCNTVPGSQITICGGLVFLLITPCEMMSFVLLHHLILCILTLLCISFSLPQKKILWHAYILI